MAKDVQDTVRQVLKALEPSNNGRGKSGGSLSGVKGIAAGAGAAALVPLAVKGAGRLVKGFDGIGSVMHPKEALSDATGKLGDSLGGKVSEKVDEAGGPGGILKDALPFGGDDDDQGGGDTKGGGPGVGKGRRMPVQQSVDIGVNIETVYNQFTQFEEWPNFMHRVTSVSQEDECTVSFATKIWTRKREFTAQIETQRPDERIKWKVSQGLTHTGVVTFHELGPNLTRVLLNMDVQPGGMIEKLARGMRNVKRAARGDLHRFKALIEMTEQETGAWRGVIEDGEVVEEHDPSYDENREYGDLDEMLGQEDEDQDEENEDQDEDEENEENEDETEGDTSESDEDEDGEEEESEPPRRRRSQSRNSSGSRSRNGHSGNSGRSRAGASSGGQTRRRQTRSRNGSGE